MTIYSNFPRKRMVYLDDDGLTKPTVRCRNTLAMLVHKLQQEDKLPAGAAQFLIDLGNRLSVNGS